jgi:hypothetical protein
MGALALLKGKTPILQDLNEHAPRQCNRRSGLQQDEGADCAGNQGPFIATENRTANCDRAENSDNVPNEKLLAAPKSPWNL